MRSPIKADSGLLFAGAQLQIIVAANGAAGINFEHSGVDGHTVLRYVSDIYCDLILRFAKTINSASATLFKAKLSPWAKGAAKKPGQVIDEPPEELEVEPKKLEWIMTPELKLAVVSHCPHLAGSDQQAAC